MALFHHLIGAGEDRLWDRQAEQPGGFLVNHQFKPLGLLEQVHEGWVCLRTGYDDGGFSGATMDRPALQRLLADIAAGRVDTIVVYKIDRLTRSLADFAKIVETLDVRSASFVSVTHSSTRRPRWGA